MAKESGALVDSLRVSRNLLQRMLTALIGVPFIVFLLTSGGLEGATIFAAVISSLMLYEFCSIALGRVAARTLVWILSANLGFHILNYFVGPVFFGLPLVVLGFLLFFLLALFSVPYTPEHRVTRQISTRLMSAFFGWVYCGVLPLFAPAIRATRDGQAWLVGMLFIVWATDIGGYFFGKWFGKRKLYAAVSPKKTWEGAFGGAFLSIGVAAAFQYFGFLRNTSWADVAVMAVLISVASQLGDLCESVIKRSFGVKDSGKILPGHGGFLDRFDGVLFALPITYAYLWAFHS